MELDAVRRHLCFVCSSDKRQIIGREVRQFLQTRIEADPIGGQGRQLVKTSVGLCNVCAALFDLNPEFNIRFCLEAMKRRGENVV